MHESLRPFAGRVGRTRLSPPRESREAAWMGLGPACLAELAAARRQRAGDSAAPRPAAPPPVKARAERARPAESLPAAAAGPALMRDSPDPDCPDPWPAEAPPC